MNLCNEGVSSTTEQGKCLSANFVFLQLHYLQGYVSPQVDNVKLHRLLIVL